jgi:hypothetical protein
MIVVSKVTKKLYMQVIAKRLLESKQTTPHLYLSKGLYSFHLQSAILLAVLK